MVSNVVINYQKNQKKFTYFSNCTKIRKNKESQKKIFFFKWKKDNYLVSIPKCAKSIPANGNNEKTAKTMIIMEDSSDNTKWRDPEKCGISGY